MKCFDQVKPFESKVNYVDANNRVLGFDMHSSCYGSFGHGVFTAIPQDEMKAITADLEPYVFAAEQPSDCIPGNDFGGGGLAFRIVADGRPDLYVCIWNHHNGYYSHGWDFDGQEGCL